MRSSTSNSEPRSPKSTHAGNVTAADVYRLLAVIILTCFTIEATMWWYTHRISQYIRHFQEEYTQAAGSRHGRLAKSVLIAGNSTLLWGVNEDEFRNKLGPGYDCHILAMKSTTYLDWYFGLKELFRRGARPDYIVVVLPADNVDLFPVPELSAYYLIGLQDIPALARTEKLTATATSDVVVEHFSTFFTSRSVLRTKVKSYLFPGFENMATKYMRQRSAHWPPALVTNRLRDLKTLCANNGATILFVIPPTNLSDEAASNRLLELARDARLDAGMPVHDHDLTPDYYSDGFHLNEAGRNLFTIDLATYLRRQFDEPDFQSPAAAASLGDENTSKAHGTGGVTFP